MRRGLDPEKNILRKLWTWKKKLCKLTKSHLPHHFSYGSPLVSAKRKWIFPCFLQEQIRCLDVSCILFNDHFIGKMRKSLNSGFDQVNHLLLYKSYKYNFDALTFTEFGRIDFFSGRDDLEIGRNGSGRNAFRVKRPVTTLKTSAALASISSTLGLWGKVSWIVTHLFIAI